MAYLTLHLDHLRTMNEVCLNLQKEDESFMQEAKLILDLKCRLLNDDLPEGYYLNGYYVDINQTGDNLTTTYAGKTYRIQSVDNELYDYDVID